MRSMGDPMMPVKIMSEMVTIMRAMWSMRLMRKYEGSNDFSQDNE